MKNSMRHCFAFLLMLSLLFGLLPSSASASDEELVLTKVGHTSSDTVSITNSAVRSVTLTVPFSFSGNTLDLSAGLIVDKAPAIDSIITSFTAGSIATVWDAGLAGPPVSLTVTYYKGGITNAQYSTVYSIRIVRAAMVSPAFSGTIAKSVTGVMPNVKINDITFSAGDFSNLYTANDGSPITGISIAGSSLTCGALKIGSGVFYDTYVSGSFVSLRDIWKLVFDATGVGNVSYIVSAYAGGNTDTAIGSVLLTITVSAVAVPTISGALTGSISAGTSHTFSLKDFSSLFSLHGGALGTIEVMPANTVSGVWSSGGAPFTGAASFTASTIGSLKFTGSAAGTAAFTWRVSNEGGFSAPGSGTITVKSAAVPIITSSVVKAVNIGSTLNFSLNDFSSCYSLNNGTLGKLVITPVNNNVGTWYKGSKAFTGAKTFDSGDIGTLKFKGTVSGQATFTWTVSNENGTSAADGGYITVNAVTTAISYSTGLNTAKSFSAADFNSACRDATGATLNYVYFSLPAASCGTLYYGYGAPFNPGSALTANSVLYCNSAPRISDVTFVPATNYNGTFTISYTGVNTNGISYTGYIKMIVGYAGDVTYITPQNTGKTFNASDFNTACTNVTGAGLYYVYFTLPDTSYGTLFYGYSSPLNPGAIVASNTPYALENLSYITFIPNLNYTGVITIPYTGVSANNVSYTGYIKMTVGNSSVSYSTSKNTAETFTVSDFNAACISATGSALSYIVLTPPPDALGSIYYNYTSASSPGMLMTAGTNFYTAGSPNISNVTFVPAPNYTGTVTLAYTGFNVNGVSYSGSLTIKVTGFANFTDVDQSYDWASGAIDYLYAAGIVTGTSSNHYSPGGNMTRGDFMLMLCRAMGYTGSTKNNFSDVPKGSYYYDAIAIAKDLGIAQGSHNKFSPNSPLIRQDAMVFIYRALMLTGATLIPGSSSDISGFTDKGHVSSYALTAIQTLVKAGMIKGSGAKLNPAAILSRAEMAVVLYRVKLTY